MTLPDFQLSESLIIRNDQTKLPFDINDYLNFELNEDLISINGNFLNDYSNDSESENDMKDLEFINDYNSDSSFNFTPSQTFELDFNNQSIEFPKSSFNLTSITDIHHDDFQCSVIDESGLQCKNSINCKLHTYQQKYIIQRSKDLDHLISNFNTLNKLNESFVKINQINKSFIDVLINKLEKIDKNPENRLLEFQYRNDLKNFATCELYKDTF